MEIDELMGVVESLNAADAFWAHFSADEWRALAPYLSCHEIRAGDLLIKQGDTDRTMYFIGKGTLQVYLTDATPGSHRVAMLRPGAVVGEPALFDHAVRMANVEAMTPCVLWALRGARMDELAQAAPVLALKLLRAARAVMTVRLQSTVLQQAVAA